MPSYRSLDRAASAIAASPLIPASTRGSSWATSATTNRQPSSATAAGRIWVGTDSAPPPVAAHRPVTTPPGRNQERNRPSRTQASSQFQPLAVSSRESFWYSSSGGHGGVLDLLQRPGAGVGHRQAGSLQRAQQLAPASRG